MDDERGYRKIAIVLILLLIVIAAAAAVMLHGDTHRVTVEIEGEGTADPMESDVGDGDSLEIRYAPAEGWMLEGVYVDGSKVETSGGILVLEDVRGDIAVRLVFVEESSVRTLTVSVIGDGTADPVGTSIRRIGETVPLLFVPADGCVIDRVEVDGATVGSINRIELTMDSDHSVTVVFRAATERDPTVDLNVDVVSRTTGADYGSVDPSGLVRVAYGGTLVVAIELNPGYTLESVAVDGKEVPAEKRVVIEDITGDRSVRIVVSHEVPKTWTVSISASSGGRTSPTGAVTVVDGEDLTISIVPDGGYRLSSLIVDGASVGTGLSSYTLENVVSDHAVRAEFSAIPSPPPVDPGVRGAFEVYLKDLTGTEVRDGSLTEIEDPATGRITDAGVEMFRTGNMVPGVSQKAVLELRNGTDAELFTAVTVEKLAGLDGWEPLAREIDIRIECDGNVLASCSLLDMLGTPTWSVDVGTMDPGTSREIGITLSLPQDAPNSIQGLSLSFELGFEAYS